MSTEPFLSPKLTGPRFEGHAIPLEFLKDLAVLEELIIEVAKVKYLEQHPDRQRTPRGFTDGVEFKLTGIGEGSAIAIISLSLAIVGNALFPPPKQTYFELGRDAIASAIRAADMNQKVTDHLPEKTLTYFDRIGRSLRDGEAIEFTTTPQTGPARLTKETRRRLILASERVKELTEDTAVRGTVPEADQDNMTFEVQLFDGRKVNAPIATQHLDTILEAFNGYKDGTRVLLQGVGRFSRSDRLLGFESIEHVNILDACDISARIEELQPLQNGWLEGRGIAPSNTGLQWLASSFAQNYPENIPLPYLYPTEEGGVRAEWSRGPSEASLDINLETHGAEWHLLDIETGIEDFASLNLDADGWDLLIKRILGMNGGEK